MDPIDAGLMGSGKGSRVKGLQLSDSYYSDVDGTATSALESN